MDPATRVNLAGRLMQPHRGVKVIVIGFLISDADPVRPVLTGRLPELVTELFVFPPEGGGLCDRRAQPVWMMHLYKCRRQPAQARAHQNHLLWINPVMSC